MAWFFLILAAACEMVWPLGFKYSAGFTRIWPTAGTFAVMIVSFFCLSRATAAGIPIGTAYAVWTGLGAAGTAIIGMYLFHDPRDWQRLVCLTLIIVGAVGLKLFARGQPGVTTPVAVETSADNPGA